MPSRGQAFSLEYFALDTAAKAGKTGDNANHTLRWVKDGTSAAPTNAPTEVDATNAPGLYKIAITTAEATADAGTLAGKSSTSGVVIVPASVLFNDLSQVAARVWSEPRADYVDATGTFGEALQEIDPETLSDAIWGADASGYGTGTFGEIVFARAGYKLAADGLDAVVVESGIHARQALRAVLAVLAGAETRPDATTVAYAAAGSPGTPRVSASVGTGLRGPVTLTLGD